MAGAHACQDFERLGEDELAHDLGVARRRSAPTGQGYRRFGNHLSSEVEDCGALARGATEPRPEPRLVLGDGLPSTALGGDGEGIAQSGGAPDVDDGVARQLFCRASVQEREKGQIYRSSRWSIRSNGFPFSGTRATSVQRCC